MPLSEDQEQQPILFGLFLSMYPITVFANLLIILAVSFESHLHTPMYFLLLNLSLDDNCFISTMVPKMIVNEQAHSRVISFEGCLTQMSLYIIFGNMDVMLLAVMAYDHFVAICHPLHYSVIMNPRLSVFLVFMSLLFSLLDSQVHSFIVLPFSHFKAVEISNFFHDPSKLLILACSDNSKNNIVMYFVVAIMGFLPVSEIFSSYYKIVSSILKVKSIGGRYKAFSCMGLT
jgi:olfactory receptor